MTDPYALLNPAALKRLARDATGLDDFGDDDFEEPLAIQARSLAEEAGLSEAGALGQQQRLVALLVQRLRLQAWLRREPAILDEEIAAPLVVVGLPRTGTTMLYRMLSVADGFVAPRHFEAAEPAPPLDWDFDAARDPRIARAEAAIAAMLAVSPEINAIYPFEALAPEESIYLVDPSLRSTAGPSLARVPTYHRWFMQADKAPAYRYLRRTLQLLQWQQLRLDSRLAPRRWLLKTPDHLHSLDALLAEFPGAGIIQTHRDPLRTIPSICSFIRALHALSTDEPDALAVGDAWCDMFAVSTERAMTVRRRHPAAFLDVHYEETVAEPHAVAERVFAFLGRELPEAVWQEMQRWREANRREARPAHDYHLADFGLTEARIRRQFAAYRRQFIEPEAA
jgi:hypothetical protein